MAQGVGGVWLVAVQETLQLGIDLLSFHLCFVFLDLSF